MKLRVACGDKTYDHDGVTSFDVTDREVLKIYSQGNCIATYAQMAWEIATMLSDDEPLPFGEGA